MTTRRESIKLFLDRKARPDMAALYHPGMEVQVNVAQDGGERVEGEYEGHTWVGWTDGSQTWKGFRIPHNAKSNPTYSDSKINFDLAAHADGIGLTGWDWEAKKSLYVAFDFDAICGHSDKHTKKLTDSELAEVRKTACAIPWVTVRQSTSGNGLHLYVKLDGVPTANHTEHSALARAILGKMTALTGFDFDTKVDNCGGVIWVWHRKFDKVGGIGGPGLKLIKQGETLFDIPINWRDHVKVTSGRSRKVRPSFIDGENEEQQSEDWFEELCGQHTKVQLDETHKKLMEYLDKTGAMHWWDADHHLLVCHTYDLMQAHEALGMRGLFKTNATGREHGADQNCFCFPMRKGVWSVRRHTRGVQEHDSWDQDAGGWTRCYLNRDPDLKTAARSYGGVENDKGAFVFREAEMAIEAAKSLGTHLNLPNFVLGREAKLKAHKDGRLIVEIKRESGDSTEKMSGWIEEKGQLWRRIVSTQVAMSSEPELPSYDDVVRHLISEEGADNGWVVNSDGLWCTEPYQNVKLAFGAFGLGPKDASLVMGSLITKPWMIINRPFQPEYVGDRRWNRNAAQLAFPPAMETDPTRYTTWTKLLQHCGSGLDVAIKDHPWCKQYGIRSGGDYLKCWIAALFQETLERLPYLFFYGPQSSGKSTFHEALSLLITRGVMRADNALTSQSGFNGELFTAVLCVVEETDLRHNKSQAYNRIKDWVTSNTISIHIKGKTPYATVNSTHWVQCANDIEFCPIFPGDTRVTMAFVKALEEMIPKSELMAKLTKEAPDFLAAVMAMEIPPPYDRLRIPMIVTDDKNRAEKLNQTELERFLEECTYPVDGEMIKVSELHERFQEWLDPDRVHVWTKIKMGRELESSGTYVKGRSSKDKGQWYIGNVAWQGREPGTEPKKRLVLVGEMLKHEGEV